MVSKRPDADRRVRQADRLARVLRVLQLIQSRGRWNVTTIAQELQCSERTIFRDLQVLSLAGIPWYMDGEEQCYRVRPDFRFPVLKLTQEEVLGQAIATVLSNSPGLKIGIGAGPTTAKIAVLSDDDTQRTIADAERVISILDLKLADHSQHQEIIRTVQWALLRCKQLVGQYRSPYQDKLVRLHLHPYRLCLVKQAWYLIGRPADAQEPRTYRIARFKMLRMIDDPAIVSADFDLKAYFGNAWAVYRGEESYEVEILFTPEAATLVNETAWHHTQKVRRHKDGSVSLTFKVDGLTEILWWILGWSGRAKVIRPPKLQEMVVEQLRTTLEMNQAKGA